MVKSGISTNYRSSIFDLLKSNSPQVIPYLFNMLKDVNSIDNRMQAMRTLNRINNKFKNEIMAEIAVLLGELHSDNMEKKISATIALGYVGHAVPNEAIEKIVDSLQAKNQVLIKSSISSLGKLGKVSSSVINILLKRYDSATRVVRLRMLQAFSMIGFKAFKAVPIITDELWSSDQNIKIQAIIALGKLKSEARTAVPSLKKLYQEGDNMIKMYAGTALASIGTPDALNFLDISEYNL